MFLDAYYRYLDSRAEEAKRLAFEESDDGDVSGFFIAVGICALIGLLILAQHVEVLL